jgi:hypothetical protein
VPQPKEAQSLEASDAAAKPAGDETPTGEAEVLLDDDFGIADEPFAPIELLDDFESGAGSDSDAPLDVTLEAAPAGLASEAPTDELRVYDDGVEEELDLLPEVELDLIDDSLPDAPDTQVTDPAPSDGDTATEDTDKSLFETPGTDLSELPGDEPGQA